MAGITATKTSRKTGKKTTEKVNLTPVTKAEFQGGGRMLEKSKPLVKTATRKADKSTKSTTITSARSPKKVY